MTAVPSVRPRPASKKTAPFRPSSGRTGRLTTLVISSTIRKSSKSNFLIVIKLSKPNRSDRSDMTLTGPVYAKDGFLNSDLTGLQIYWRLTGRSIGKYRYNRSAQVLKCSSAQVLNSASQCGNENIGAQTLGFIVCSLGLHLINTGRWLGISTAFPQNAKHL